MCLVPTEYQSSGPEWLQWPASMGSNRKET